MAGSSSGTVKQVDDPSAGVGTILKAALPLIPGVNQVPGIKKSGGDIPDLTLRSEGVTVEADHVEAYADLCGFEPSERLPLTYLHMLAFPLHMGILTDSSFPYPAVGTVHLENRITRRHHVARGAKVDVEVTATNKRPAAKGTIFDMVATVTSEGETVWESTSTYLRVGKRNEDGEKGTEFDEVPKGPITWKLDADLGRRYASVSGDYNPIHLYPITAKALGFPRQIAHGMWTKARCVAALENRIPEAATVAVAWKKPVLLPAKVDFGSARAEGGYDFALTRPKDGAPHLQGSVREA